ncbi:MAG TPA: hypothetical protein PLM63_00175 [bacterium]|nr:hypothetical protein [Patescibacteria group bacterium]HOC96319.1 hypothetical protein [bacterium]HPO10993.1 hypothetical protein [bacterium]HQL11924.1 hypothetical protein [bacterium]
MSKKKIIVLLISLVSFGVYFNFVYADQNSIDLNDPTAEGNQYLEQIVTKTGQKEVSSVPTVFNRAIQIFLGLSSTIFLIFLIVGGFQYLGSKGNINEINKSFNLIKTGAIGLAVILLAYTITRFVLSQINSIGK